MSNMMIDPNLPPELQVELQRIQAQEQVSNAMVQRGMTPVQTNGGPMSWTQGLGQMLNAYSGRRGMDDLAQQKKALAQKATEQQGEEVRKVTEALMGRQADAGVPDELGGGPTRPAATANPREAIQLALQAQSPLVRNLGGTLLASQLKAQGENPYAKIDPDKFTPESLAKYHVSRLPSDLVPVRKMDLSPSGQVVNLFSAKPGDVVADPNKPFAPNPTPGGAPVPNLPFQQFEKDKAGLGGTKVNVGINTEKTLFGNLAEQVGKQVATGAEHARAAVNTINTVNGIREALDSGKIVAGPGTTARVFMNQLSGVLGVQGKDATEQLTNTRKAIQGLAQLELDAAQQMRGQGAITEAERSIIRRAASGDIDGMTVPELKILMTSMDKTARGKIRQNAEQVKKLSANPNSASVVPYMTVAEPPAYGDPRGAPQLPDDVRAYLEANKRP